MKPVGPGSTTTRTNASRTSTLSSALIVVLLALHVSVLSTPVAAETARDYCATNNYADAGVSNVMQFTKELVTHEYAILNEYKSLHCCAKGYQSIEW